MRLKTNLHMHTSDDPVDPVAHSLKEIVDHAAGHHFDVLAITCHHRAAWTPEYAAYAAEKGILLIPGAELSVANRVGGRAAHVLMLGVGPDVEAVRTFDELAKYRAEHPEAFIIAPHPFLPGGFSLQDYFEPHIHLFDAVEHSWFYSRRFNINLRATEVAERHGLPVIATSDTHFFDFMHDNYATVDAEAKTQEALFAAIRAGKIENYSAPRRLIREMIIPWGLFAARTAYLRAKQRLGLEKFRASSTKGVKEA